MNGGVAIRTRLGKPSEMVVIMFVEGKPPLRGIEMFE